MDLVQNMDHVDGFVKNIKTKDDLISMLELEIQDLTQQNEK